MRTHLDPVLVGRRLAVLAEHYVPETIDEGRARLRRDRLSSQAFASSVERRLDELRALDELTRYLHAIKRP
jgi:hypothetical protein